MTKVRPRSLLPAGILEWPRGAPLELFRQVLHEDLGCASYVVADGGEGAVVDPGWEIEAYLALANEHGFRIAQVLETHTHADHVSGRGRLLEATGADAAGGELSIGDTTIRRLPTPGHRPEHVAYLVADRSRTDEPWLVLTGDSLFVGDVARPDLAVEPEEGARALFRSLRRLLELDDGVEIWPGHIGGSLCGGSGMSEKTELGDRLRTPLQPLPGDRRRGRLRPDAARRPHASAAETSSGSSR